MHALGELSSAASMGIATDFNEFQAPPVMKVIPGRLLQLLEEVGSFGVSLSRHTGQEALQWARPPGLGCFSKRGMCREGSARSCTTEARRGS